MTGWLVVVPIKRFTTAKSRLDIPDRAEVARAVALDTVHVLMAVLAVRTVLVVTDDLVAGDLLTGEDFAALSWPTGVRLLQQRRPGLSAAVAEGRAAAALLQPGAPVAVVLGDLPRVGVAAVTAALTAAARVPVGFVRDAAGTGTTVLTTAPGVRFDPAFGRDSAARHRALGAAELPAGAALRHDLDTTADLAVARRGAGPRLAALLAKRPSAV